MAAGLSVDLDRWRGEFDELMLRVGARVEPRRRASAFVRGLLAGLPRVNCWSVAEYAGDAGPRGMQRLLPAAVWDEAGVRDDLRGYVLEHFAGPGAVLVVDETGDVKKGSRTAGVQRQYTGTAGRVENAQVAVYLALRRPGRDGVHRPGLVPAGIVDQRSGPLPGGRSARRHGVRDQAGAGEGDDRPGPGWRGTRRVGRCRRGLRRGPRSSAPGSPAADSATSWR